MTRQLRVGALSLAFAAMLAAGGLLAGGPVMARGTGGADSGNQPAAGAPAEANRKLPAPAPDHPLAGTEWRLVKFLSMDDAIGEIRPDDPSLYTMRLEGDGTVGMRLNCNRAMGSWFSEASAGGNSGTFRFGLLAMTRAFCPPPSLDEQIAADASFVRSYVLEGGRLHLSLMADAGIYTWEPVTGNAAVHGVPATPEAGGPRNFEVSVRSGRLNLRARPSTSADILAAYAHGTLLDNLGCRHAEGRVWCDVQRLGGGPRGYVAAEFLRPAISPDGRAPTGPDDSALRAGRGRFDATGKLPCARALGQPMMQCEFGVTRSGGGYATVVVKIPGGRGRAIFFRMGRPIGANTSKADGYPEFKASKQGDLNMIRVGSERYEIPDAVVLGGRPNCGDSMPIYRFEMSCV